ncbi:unnamed protein product, partial [Musa textilis]
WPPDLAWLEAFQSRVRPIRDADDSREFKAALKLAAGLVAEDPASPYALELDSWEDNKQIFQENKIKGRR